MRSNKTADSSQSVGEFQGGAAYTFAEMRRRGFSAAALREMQRRGLLVRRFGKMKLIVGRDLLHFFEQLPVASVAKKVTDNASTEGNQTPQRAAG